MRMVETRFVVPEGRSGIYLLQYDFTNLSDDTNATTVHHRQIIHAQEGTAYNLRILATPFHGTTVEAVPFQEDDYDPVDDY